MDENKESCLTVADVKNIGQLEFTEKIKVSTEESAEIEKILSSTVDLCECKIESIDNKATISGKMFYQIIYKDTEGMVIVLKNSAPFVQNYENDQISSVGKLMLKNICVDASTEFSGKDFDITVNCSMQIVNYDKINHCVITELNENMAIKT